MALSLRTVFRDLASLFEVLSVLECSVIIVGDFNVRLERVTDENAMAMIKLIDAFSLLQHIREPTHELGLII